MSTLIAFAVSLVSAVLQVVATLDVTVASPWIVYQPKAPKSLLK